MHYTVMYPFLLRESKDTNQNNFQNKSTYFHSNFYFMNKGHDTVVLDYLDSILPPVLCTNIKRSTNGKERGLDGRGEEGGGD